MTNLRPDQISEIAQILTSTSPASRPVFWTLSKDRSVVTPETFLGHATQRIPLGCSRVASFAKLFVSSLLLWAKNRMRSHPSITCAEKFAPAGKDPNFLSKPLGAFTSATRECSFMPSFFAKGVPE